MTVLSSMNDIRKRSGLTCTFIVFLALNIAMIVVGSQAIVAKACPLEFMIPIYLTVAGSTSVALLIVRLLMSKAFIPLMEKWGSPDPGEGTNLSASEPAAKKVPIVECLLKALRVFDSLASIFSTCWLIVGSIYVYKNFQTVSWDPMDQTNFCQRDAYLFAFFVITIGYVSLTFSLIAATVSVCRKGSLSPSE